MTYLFAVLFSAYLLHAVVSNWRSPKVDPARPTRSMLLLQTPLFLTACYFTHHAGEFSRELVSPLYVAVGLVLGHMIFGVSLLLTHRVLRDAAEHFLDFNSLWRFLVESPSILLRFFVVSITEEIIYRVAAQGLLLDWGASPFVAIGVVAVAFSVVHKHFFRNPPAQSAEFLAFSVLLGALYYGTGSLILVVVVHTMRNLESVYLEYLVKLDEAGSEAEALQYIEDTYTMKAPQKT